jgi:hypothetical protein
VEKNALVLSGERDGKSNHFEIYQSLWLLNETSLRRN